MDECYLGAFTRFELPSFIIVYQLLSLRLVVRLSVNENRDFIVRIICRG